MGFATSRLQKTCEDDNAHEPTSHTTLSGTAASANHRRKSERHVCRIYMYLPASKRDA